MDRTELGRITPGRTYRYHEARTVEGVVKDIEGGTYRVQGFAYQPDVDRWMVAFVGLDGGDRGKKLVAPQAWFVLRFRPVEDAKPEPVPETKPEPASAAAFAPDVAPLLGRAAMAEGA